MYDLTIKVGMTTIFSSLSHNDNPLRPHIIVPILNDPANHCHTKVEKRNMDKKKPLDFFIY